MTTPRATYRLQLNEKFTFADATAQVPYLAQLGISHLYLSPIQAARKGSMHGYDVIDHSRINPEIGGEEGLRQLVKQLRKHKMGLIVDIVPNHMAVGGNDNALWLDLLEWGRSSRYAGFFDVDWDVPDPALKNRVLAPFLGKSYGETLAAGEIKLAFDSSTGRFHLDYYEHRFPIATNTYAQLLRLGGDALASAETRFQSLATQQGRNRYERFASACASLAQEYATQPTVANAIAQLLQHFDASTPAGQRSLHQLLERQHYRLAFWRTAADEINWRRFFDVIQLAAIRVQDPTVFAIVHNTIFRLYAEGLIDGVRIDHIDGISDPRLYCRRLRQHLQQLEKQRPPEAPTGPAYCIVEKILATEEHLPRDWQVDGTTGYSFMNDVSAMLHDPAGEAELTKLWTQLRGRSADFEAESQQARRWILQELLAAEFNACVHALHQVARSETLTRDWSQLAIRRVLREILVQFPIYRTYADAKGRSEAHSEIMRTAIDAAKPHCRDVDVPLLELIDRWLGAEPLPATLPAKQRQMRLRAITRFQQLSSPLAAKSVEDTAFYRHGKLLSRNEVGANPAQFATTPADLHAECKRRAAFFPNAMLATATHDHKRGEDLRARLAVLSEVPQQWSDQVRGWMRSNLRHKLADGPTFADEYMLYQMLIGGWPYGLELDDSEGLANLRDRLLHWWIKALREAKQISSWGSPNLDYERNCEHFLHVLLDPAISRGFLQQVVKFAHSISIAGAINSLSQTLLKLTTPGVPDTYQGCELWDFSFVDPDNRRPVDYPLRHAMLDQHRDVITSADWKSGAVKLDLITRLLQLRAQLPDVFSQGDYRALEVTGALAQHVFAFTRRYKNTTVMVAVLRLTMPLLRNLPEVDPSLWNDTTILLPRLGSTGKDAQWHWKDCFSSAIFASKTSRFPCKNLFLNRTYSLLVTESQPI